MKARAFKIPLSTDRMKALTPMGRYVFALAGHSFNELMFLQKLLHSTRRAPGTIQPVLDASLSLSMFVLRTLVGKLNEAMLKLRGKKVRAVLAPEYLDPAGLTDRWNAALKLFDKTEWIRKVRNEGAFHYFDPEQWIPHLDDAMCEQGYIWDGQRMGDTLFYWADVAAAVPIMKTVNANDPIAGLDTMLQELSELIGNVTDILAIALRTYIHRTGLGFDRAERVDFEAPLLDGFEVHYFHGNDHLV